MKKKADVKQNRQRYSDESKEQALRRAEQEGVATVAKDLKLPASQLCQHALDPGFVVRQIIPDGNGGFSIDTRGWGTVSSPLFNSSAWAAGIVWGGNSTYIDYKADGFKWPWEASPVQLKCAQTTGPDGKSMEACQ